MNRLIPVVFLLLVAACSHPLEIIGEGDIESVDQSRGCLLAEQPCANYVVHDYNVTYTAKPHPGWRFIGWNGSGCDNQFPECSFNVSSENVHLVWGEVAPPLVAVFEPIDPYGRSPNIIHIMADDFGYGELGSYGQQLIQTPNIDQLAATGMRFTQHYAGSSACAPSRFAYMTGLHSGTTGVTTNAESYQLSEHWPGIAQLMQGAGYTTGIVGKWGLGRPETPNYPLNQGFDYFFGYESHKQAHNYYPAYLMENDVQFPLPGNSPQVQTHLSGKVTYAPDLINERATEFIKQNRNTKFYLQLHYNLPHVNNELHAATGNGWEHPGISRYHDTDWTVAEQDYAELVGLMDDYVGEVMSALDAYGLTENTIVFFASDNGPAGIRTTESLERFQATGGLRGKKGELFEGGIRVPLIAWGPSYIDSAQIAHEPTAFWDMLPTLSEIAAVNEPVISDGISFAPILFGTGEIAERDFLYWAFNDSIAVIQGDSKWVRHKQIDYLFDLYNDPNEEVNLAAIDPEKLQALMDLAEAYQDD